MLRFLTGIGAGVRCFRVAFVDWSVVLRRMHDPPYLFLVGIGGIMLLTLFSTWFGWAIALDS